MLEARPADELTAKPCPYCLSDDIVIDKLGHLYCATCFSCGMRGPRLTTRDEALEAWNRIACMGSVEK